MQIGFHMKQRDANWFEARRGRVTASNVSKVLMATTSQTYIKYRSQIVLERLGVVTEDDYISPAMQWGLMLSHKPAPPIL